MFCYQCEQTAKGTGCTVSGACGKEPDVAALQDLLIYGLKGVSQYAFRAGVLGKTDRKIDKFVVDQLFTTITNVNFDPSRMDGIIGELNEVLGKAKSLYETACKEAGKDIETLEGPCKFDYTGTLKDHVSHGAGTAITFRIQELGEDITGLQELLVYGLKGSAAYASHAAILGKEDAEIYASFHDALNFLTTPVGQTLDALVAKNLEWGGVNLKVMALLDEANTGKYGHPVPTPVRINPVKGKAILVSGHDLHDLEALLIQTEGKGINIYTHSEMLPCHGYPELKKYKHLVANYGGAWQDQRKEFDEFPGAILMTTNCIQKPKPSYIDRIFTCGLVAFPGVKHVSSKDFSPVIEAALKQNGFSEDGPDKTITVGFGHNAVMGVAPVVIDAVKSGAIKHFFLIGGCDGAKSGRNYFTEFAEKVPKDCVILTLACGKYRFNKLDFGDIGGIPRLLDCGQCNDAYSAVQIAVALAGAFDTDVNGLPLSFILSWFEQKAVCILLTLLHLGVQKIKLGPSLPAFISPAVLKVLVENFKIAPIATADADLKEILG
jgi:hydroxylamine reductase